MLCKKEVVMQLIVKILLGPFIFKSSNCRQALGQIQDQKKLKSISIILNSCPLQPVKLIITTEAVLCDDSHKCSML